MRCAFSLSFVNVFTHSRSSDLCEVCLFSLARIAAFKFMHAFMRACFSTYTYHYAILIAIFPIDAATQITS